MTNIDISNSFISYGGCYSYNNKTIKSLANAINNTRIQQRKKISNATKKKVYQALTKIILQKKYFHWH